MDADEFKDFFRWFFSGFRREIPAAGKAESSHPPMRHVRFPLEESPRDRRRKKLLEFTESIIMAATTGGTSRADFYGAQITAEAKSSYTIFTVSVSYAGHSLSMTFEDCLYTTRTDEAERVRFSFGGAGWSFNETIDSDIYDHIIRGFTPLVTAIEQRRKSRRDAFWESVNAEAADRASKQALALASLTDEKSDDLNSMGGDRDALHKRSGG